MTDSFNETKRELYELMQRSRRERFTPPTPEGVTPSEARTMMTVSALQHTCEDVRPGRVAELTHTTPSALSQTFKTLEEKGLIERHRAKMCIRDRGYVLVTPLQVAVAYGAVATGKLLKPHLLKEVRNASGDVAASVKVETAGELDVPEADLAFMRDALNGVATDNADVSKLLNEQGIDPATVACKTGTAEYTLSLIHI